MFVIASEQSQINECISGDEYGLIATRVILGLVQGPIFPCLSAFIVPWYPIEERGTLCSMGYIGISVRNIT